MSLNHFPKPILRGFTLIELMVAVGMFAVIATLATGAYLTIVAENHEAQSLATATNSLGFMLESMTREIRTGSAYSCNASGDCPPPNGGKTFTFTNSGGQNITYKFVTGTPNQVTRTDSLGIPVNIVDPSFTVTNLTFYVTGTTKGDAFQPFVRILVTGTVPGVHGNTIPFTVETSAAMRGIDL